MTTLVYKEAPAAAPAVYYKGKKVRGIRVIVPLEPPPGRTPRS